MMNIFDMVNRRRKLVDKSKIVKAFGRGAKALCQVILSAFGINNDDRRDGSLGDFEQENGYPEELFEKYKYK